MPRGDGTGPMGMGQMTGRGAGYCTGFAAGGFGGAGRGFRRPFCAAGLPGRARLGYGAYAGAQAPKSDEKELLSRQAKYLENQLRQVKKRLSTFEEESE